MAKVAGPTLLLGSMAAVWVAAGHGPLSAPKTQAAATARDVTPAPPQHPSGGSVESIHREGDRVLLSLRTGSGTIVLDVPPGITVAGSSLAALSASATEHPVAVTLAYGPAGTLSSITPR